MSKKEAILELVYEAMDDIKDSLEQSSEFKKELNTILYGQNSILDSLSTVGLIIAIEEKVNAKFNATVTLASEKAVSLKNSPFRTVQSITDYILELLEEQK